MTEAEWLACADPQPMLTVHWGKASDRKFRLFAVACCRRIWHLLMDERSRNAVEVAERYADSLVNDVDRLSALRAAYNATWELERDDWSDFPAIAVCHTIDPGMGVDAAAVAHYAAVTKDEPSVQAALVRDIFGNPFRPLTIAPLILVWSDATIPKLAQLIYDERRFEDMLILADALMDAGCHDEEILTHCQGAGPHVRGCWVLDLLLGKS